jgi:hypothetical protein
MAAKVATLWSVLVRVIGVMGVLFGAIASGVRSLAGKGSPAAPEGMTAGGFARSAEGRAEAVVPKPAESGGGTAARMGARTPAGAGTAAEGEYRPGPPVRSAAAVRPPRQTVFSGDPAARRRWRKWQLPPTMKQRISAEAHGSTPSCRTPDPSAVPDGTADGVGIPTARSRRHDEELCAV